MVVAKIVVVEIAVELAAPPTPASASIRRLPSTVDAGSRGIHQMVLSIAAVGLTTGGRGTFDVVCRAMVAKSAISDPRQGDRGHGRVAQTGRWSR
jgi:hypothetical protein